MMINPASNPALSTPPANGTNGWTPMILPVIDGVRSYLKIADWIGGSGAKPASGMYLAETGYVIDKALATNFNVTKRLTIAQGTSVAVTGIAPITFDTAFPAAPRIVIVGAVPNVLTGPTKAELVAGSLTKTGCQVKVTGAALLTGVVSILAGAVVTVLAIEA